MITGTICFLITNGNKGKAPAAFSPPSYVKRNRLCVVEMQKNTEHTLSHVSRASTHDSKGHNTGV